MYEETNEGAIGIAILLGVTIVLALLITPKNGNIRGIFVDSAIVGVAASVILNLLSTLREGYLDPFFIIALFMGFFYAFCLSLVITGLIEGYVRLQQGRENRG